MQNYSDKTGINYFSAIRKDIMPLLPKYSPKVLEIGCGEGTTLKWLKDNNYCGTTYGLELFEDMRSAAEQNIDELIIGNAEEIVDQYQDEYFDLILCLDVLEHMIDPWKVVNILERKLKTGGVVIASIPNIRNISTLYKIIFKKSFEYTINGIMDRTHLRFFTRKEAEKLMTTKRMGVEKTIYNPLSLSEKKGKLNFITLGVMRELLTNQFLIRSIKR